MSTRRTLAIVFCLLGAAVGGAVGQDVRSVLEARGVPTDFRDAVLEIVRATEAQGLPTDALANKAIEGFAKQVPADRVLAAVRRLAGNLVTARDVVRGAGAVDPPGRLVSAAAEVLGRGMTRQQVRTVVQSAPTPESAAAGLTVAGALAAQGIESDGAVGTVARAFDQGRPLDRILDLPSVAQSMLLQGVPASDIVHQILEAGGIPGQVRSGRAQGGPPPGVPGRGPPPGKGPKKKTGSG